MVSAIANGGVYLTPHILMPEQSGSATQNQKAAPPQAAMPVKVGEELPDPLPGGAHRVISTMAAAEMRKMMEGVVLFGTGKAAQLNGYSSGGKTGTAQKIDPATHTYSKTMHIGSFAGFAPVNTPVIAVAVIMDSPKGAYYGADVAAPVFAEVAQQVLEYLGVQHDIDLRPAAPASKKDRAVAEDDTAAPDDNIEALYEAANDLPSDDPLRAAARPAASAPQSASSGSSGGDANSGARSGASGPASAASAGLASGASPGQQAQSSARPPANTVIVADATQLRVPSLLGLSVRQVIEQAGSAGFEVEIAGSGTAREQAPAAGAMVAPGTKIVVKCAR